MNRILVTIALAGMFLITLGFGMGYLYFNSKLNAFEITINTMQIEIPITQARLQNQDDLIGELRYQFGTEKLNHSDTKIKLEIANDTIKSLDDQSSLLLKTQESLLLHQNALSNSRVNAKQLEMELIKLTEMETGLKAVAALHGEVLRMKIDVEPLLGEGDLLATRGVEAFNSGNHTNSAMYFDEASQTYSLATSLLAEIAEGNAGLVEAVTPIVGLPTISHIPAIFAKSQNNAFSDIKLSYARAAQYRAAAKLAEVISEWNQLIRAPNDSHYQNWRAKIDEADHEVDLALDSLDLALELTPGRWQEIKVRELETLDWKTLSQGIREEILEE